MGQAYSVTSDTAGPQKRVVTCLSTTRPELLNTFLCIAATTLHHTTRLRNYTRPDLDTVRGKDSKDTLQHACNPWIVWFNLLNVDLMAHAVVTVAKCRAKMQALEQGICLNEALSW